MRRCHQQGVCDADVLNEGWPSNANATVGKERALSWIWSNVCCEVCEHADLVHRLPETIQQAGTGPLQILNCMTCLL
jgi:hypothetical protein